MEIKILPYGQYTGNVFENKSGVLMINYVFS